MPALATIAIPTFNRAGLLRRATASALAQDYDPLEVVISDNASTDGTEAVGRELAAADPRVRYLRSPGNIGPVANFGAVLGAARGEFFMWLADDDWLAPNFLSACIRVLESDPATVRVTGRTVWLQGEKALFVEEGLAATTDSPGERVVEYLRAVSRNSGFYGVSRTACVREIPLRDVLGGDWLHVASLAFVGKVRTVETTTLFRSVDGMSENVGRLARTAGMTRFPALVPMGAVPVNVGADILCSATYRSMPTARRYRLAARCFAVAWRRFAVGHTVRAAVAAMARALRRRLPAPAYSALRRAYREATRRITPGGLQASSGHCRSCSEMVRPSTEGQAMPSTGSSQRRPADAAGV